MRLNKKPSVHEGKIVIKKKNQKKIDRDTKDNIYCVRMSVYGCSPKCCVAYLNCSKIVLLLKYNKRFAFASMSTQYADAGEVNKYIII